MNVREAASLAIAAALGGCRGCHESHPYVPYTIESGSPPLAAGGNAGQPSASASAPPSDGGRGGFVAVAATLAPSGATRWTLDGIALQAPEGMAFVSAVVRDFDGDGIDDAFAIVRAGNEKDPGVLAYYRGKVRAEGLDAPELLAPPGEGFGHDPGCGVVDCLAVVGPRAVLAELGTSACAGQGLGAPDCWVAVVRGGTPPKVLLAFAVADPPGAPVLSVEADTANRDGDGLDNLAVRVALEGGGPVEPGPRVAATFAWVDRPAGLSRDLSATESSFSSLAATAAAKAARRKEAPQVPAYVAQGRALWRAACAEGGGPRVTGIGTGPIVCGAGRALESLGLAESRAYATAGDPLRAVLALDRAWRGSASRSAARFAEAEKWIVHVAPLSAALAVRAVSAVPIANGGRDLTWGSLAFEPSGKLLVRTRAGVVRVDPDAGDEAAAEGVADWKSGVTSPDGAMRWIEAYDPCDGLSLRAALAPTNVDELHEVALPVAPLGERCVGPRGVRASTLPIAWGAGGIEAIVEGEPILISPDLGHAYLQGGPFVGPVAPGGPRSPDGNALVAATMAGLLVRSGVYARLFRASELDGSYADQRECAVSNGATHVACVHAGRAWVGSWEGF